MRCTRRDEPHLNIVSSLRNLKLGNFQEDVTSICSGFASINNEVEIFALFVEDDRYTVPTLSIIEADDLSKVREKAEQALRCSPHHLKVEAWREDELLFVMSRDQVC